jgi:hypothetical protein
MNDSQESKLDMYQRVGDVCHNNIEIFSHVGSMVESVNNLDNLVFAIRQTAQQQASVIPKGFSAEKQKAIENVVTPSIKVANVLYVYAFNKGDQVLLSKVSINKSSFYRIRGNDVYTLAKNISSEAKNCISELAYYGINEQDVNLLDEAISVYEGFINRPQIVKEERVKYTKNLKELFVDADSLLYDQLDKLIVLFKTSAPDFYFAYQTARNVIETGRRNRKNTDTTETTEPTEPTK